MPTPNGVNNLLQFLQYVSNSPIIEQQESKSGCPSYMLISHCYVTISGAVFRVQHCLSRAKIQTLWRNCKRKSEKNVEFTQGHVKSAT